MNAALSLQVGAIFVNQGELFVLTSNVTANKATAGAGGLALNQASGSINNTLFMLNQVPCYLFNTTKDLYQ